MIPSPLFHKSNKIHQLDNAGGRDFVALMLVVEITAELVLVVEDTAVLVLLVEHTDELAEEEEQQQEEHQQWWEKYELDHNSYEHS
jgi:hypothetical protein